MESWRLAGLKLYLLIHHKTKTLYSCMQVMESCCQLVPIWVHVDEFFQPKVHHYIKLRHNLPSQKNICLRNTPLQVQNWLSPSVMSPWNIIFVHLQFYMCVVHLQAQVWNFEELATRCVVNYFFCLAAMVFTDNLALASFNLLNLTDYAHITKVNKRAAIWFLISFQRSIGVNRRLRQKCDLFFWILVQRRLHQFQFPLTHLTLQHIRNSKLVVSPFHRA